MKNTGLGTLIDQMSTNPELWGMGHNQNFDTLDLGLGWLYYGLARSTKPRRVVVIGSWRGFVPLIIGQALEDNQSGELIFIDPSYVDDHWTQNVDAYFTGYGIHCICHHRMTSEEFVESQDFQKLEVDMLFIDGMHTYSQCKFEFESFYSKLAPNFTVLLHDSTSKIKSNLYGKGHEYEHSVWKLIEELQERVDLSVIQIPVDQGIAIIKPRLV